MKTIFITNSCGICVFTVNYYSYRILSIVKKGMTILTDCTQDSLFVFVWQIYYTTFYYSCQHFKAKNPFARQYLTKGSFKII